MQSIPVKNHHTEHLKLTNIIYQLNLNKAGEKSFKIFYKRPYQEDEKDKLQTQRHYLQTTQLTKDQYLAYIKNSQKSAVKKTSSPNRKWENYMYRHFAKKEYTDGKKEHIIRQ